MRELTLTRPLEWLIARVEPSHESSEPT